MDSTNETISSSIYKPFHEKGPQDYAVYLVHSQSTGGSLSEASSSSIYEPRHEKTCLQGLRPGKTGLLSYRDQLEP